VNLFFLVASPESAKALYKIFVQTQGPGQNDEIDHDFITSRVSVRNAYMKSRLRHTTSGHILSVFEEELRDLEHEVRTGLMQLFPDLPFANSGHFDDYSYNVNLFDNIIAQFGFGEIAPISLKTRLNRTEGRSRGSAATY
jgi:hypothetical protein